MGFSDFNLRADPLAVQWCRTGATEPEPEKIRTGGHNRALSSSGKNWKVPMAPVRTAEEWIPLRNGILREYLHPSDWQLSYTKGL